MTLGPSALIAVTQVATTPLAERYLYLPIAPFSLLVAFGFYKLGCAKKYNLSSASIFLFVLVIFILGGFMVHRQSVWKNRVTFWADAAKDTNSSVPLVNYGMALIDDGKLDEGAKVLRRGLKDDMKSSSMIRSIALNNLGIGYMKQGQIQKAHEAFLDAIKEDKRFHKSYYHLGVIYHSVGKQRRSRDVLERSKTYFLKSIRVKKNYAKGHLGAARIYFELGEFENAKKHAKKALKYGLIDPDDQQAMAILNSG